MGACRFPTSDSKGGGEAMGYLMGDIVEEVTGVLRLSYYNGAKCSGSGRSRTVHIFFQCEKGAAIVSYTHTHTHTHCVQIPTSNCRKMVLVTTKSNLLCTV